MSEIRNTFSSQQSIAYINFIITCARVVAKYLQRLNSPNFLVLGANELTFQLSCEHLPHAKSCIWTNIRRVECKNKKDGSVTKWTHSPKRNKKRQRGCDQAQSEYLCSSRCCSVQYHWSVTQHAKQRSLVHRTREVKTHCFRKLSEDSEGKWVYLADVLFPSLATVQKVCALILTLLSQSKRYCHFWDHVNTLSGALVWCSGARSKDVAHRSNEGYK